jgi:integrase
VSSVKQRPDGMWRARYRDEAGKEHARHFKKKGQADRWLDEITADVLTGRYVDPGAGKITFAAYFEKFMALQTYEDTTIKAMRLAVKGVPFADHSLNRIRRSHIQAWVKALRAGLADSTVRTRFTNVRTVFKAAMDDKRISEDPTDKVTIPKRSEPEKTLRIPTTAEVDALLRAAAPDGFDLFIALCAFSGLRLGEAAALTVDDVVFLERRLKVERQVQRAGGGEVQVRPPKHGSTRTVALPDALLTRLAEHITTLPPPADGLPAYIFATASGQPPHQNTVGHRWRKACAAASVAGVRMHDLRHFYASGLIAQGCDVVKVQKALGHQKATTTLAYYAHLWHDAEDTTRLAAASLMEQVYSVEAATSSA